MILNWLLGLIYILYIELYPARTLESADDLKYVEQGVIQDFLLYTKSANLFTVCNEVGQDSIFGDQDQRPEGRVIIFCTLNIANSRYRLCSLVCYFPQAI